MKPAQLLQFGGVGGSTHLYTKSSPICQACFVQIKPKAFMCPNPLVTSQSPVPAGGPVFADGFTQGISPSSKPNPSPFQEEIGQEQGGGVGLAPPGRAWLRRAPAVHGPTLPARPRASAGAGFVAFTGSPPLINSLANVPLPRWLATSSPALLARRWAWEMFAVHPCSYPALPRCPCQGRGDGAGLVCFLPKPVTGDGSDFTAGKQAVKPLPGHGRQRKLATLLLFVLQGCLGFISLSLYVV